MAYACSVCLCTISFVIFKMYLVYDFHNKYKINIAKQLTLPRLLSASGLYISGAVPIFRPLSFVFYVRHHTVFSLPLRHAIICWWIQNKGLRAKLRSEDGNDIDTMFVDRRAADKTTHNNGNTLV